MHKHTKKHINKQTKKELRHYTLFGIFAILYVYAVVLDNDIPARNSAYQCEIRSELCDPDVYSREYGYRRSK